MHAYWLPALSEVTSRGWAAGQNGNPAELLLADLSPGLLQEQLHSLRAARRNHLADRPVREIVGAVDRVASRFLDRSDSIHERAVALLGSVTGASTPMTELVLARMAADWREDRLVRLLRAEFGDPSTLDHFVDRPEGAGRVHAQGPELVFHLFSGNVPGVAVTSLIRALLVKSASFGKTASGEPILPVLFAEAVAEEDPKIGDCLAVAYWPGGEEALEEVALGEADAVIAYGSRDTIQSVRTRTPSGTPFLEYGNRMSLGVIAREALTRQGAADLSADAAQAVATFDQQGCVSPHMIYVEEGGAVGPEEWSEMLAEAMERVETELPRGKLSSSEAAAIQQARGRAELAALSRGRGGVFSSRGGTEWTVILDPDPAPSASCLNRTVYVKPVTSLEQVGEVVEPIGSLLQTVGVAGPEDRLEPLARRFARAGVSRLTPLSKMAWPVPWWHHDGRPPLSDLVRWCDWE